jgi:hypothetical protein
MFLNIVGAAMHKTGKIEIATKTLKHQNPLKAARLFFFFWCPASGGIVF